MENQVTQKIIDQIDRPYQSPRQVDLRKIATAIVATLLIGIAIGSSCTRAQEERRAYLQTTYPSMFAGEPGQWGQE